MKTSVGMGPRNRTIRREAAELRKCMILSRMCCIKFKNTKLLEVKKKERRGEDILIEVLIEL
jgi:hypothetical protein